MLQFIICPQERMNNNAIKACKVLATDECHCMIVRPTFSTVKCQILFPTKPHPSVTLLRLRFGLGKGMKKTFAMCGFPAYRLSLLHVSWQ